MSKQLLGWILAGVAILWWLWYSLYQKWIFVTNSTPEIMKFVPNQFDQFVYFSVDDQLVEYLIKNGSLAMSGEDFKTIAKTIDSMVMYQYLSGDVPYSLLFVKDNWGFSLENAQKLGLIPDAEWYSSKNISKDIIVYGDASSMNFFDNYKDIPVYDNKDLHAYFKDFWSHNVGFVSTPLKSVGNNPLIAQFANTLKYTQVKSTIGEKLSWVLRMQFDSDVLPTIVSDFSPNLMASASSESSIVLEFKKLLELFSVQKSQFSTLASLWLWQVSPEVSTLLTSKDFESLYDVLNGNIMFEMKPSPSMIWMSAKLVFSTPGIYSIVDKLSPVLAWLFSNIVGTGNVTVDKKENKLSFNMISPLLQIETGENQIDIQNSLSVSVAANTETISLFDVASESVLWSTISPTKANTVAVFYSQWPQVNSLVGLPAVEEGTWMVAMEWSVYLDGRNALMIEFKQQ